MHQNKVQGELHYIKLLKMHFHGHYNVITIQVEYLTFYNLKRSKIK